MGRAVTVALRKVTGLVVGIVKLTEVELVATEGEEEEVEEGFPICCSCCSVESAAARALGELLRAAVGVAHKGEEE